MEQGHQARPEEVRAEEARERGQRQEAGGKGRRRARVEGREEAEAGISGGCIPQMAAWTGEGRPGGGEHELRVGCVACCVEPRVEASGVERYIGESSDESVSGGAHTHDGSSSSAMSA